MLVKILNGIIHFLGDMVAGVLAILPSSPFTFTSTDWPEWANWFMYFIPAASIITHMTAILVTVAVWFVVRWALRFARAIQ
jgi:hypothetical protein